MHTDYDESLAATIELSLDSPTFRKLGARARDLLGVVAFFSQGIDEKNLDWLFPTIPDRNHIFEEFCALSLTSRSGGFITMLAPIRDHLHPRHILSFAHPGIFTSTGFLFVLLLMNRGSKKPGGFRQKM